MTDFVRGQKGKLADIGCVGAFQIVLNIAAQGMEVDIACFGLDENDKLSDDRYMVFFNQKSCPGGGVTLEIGDDKSTFTTDVSRLPDQLHKLEYKSPCRAH
jgi:tellurite resistance protein TerA